MGAQGIVSGYAVADPAFAEEKSDPGPAISRVKWRITVPPTALR